MITALIGTLLVILFFVLLIMIVVGVFRKPKDQLTADQLNLIMRSDITQEQKDEILQATKKKKKKKNLARDLVIGAIVLLVIIFFNTGDDKDKKSNTDQDNTIAEADKGSNTDTNKTNVEQTKPAKIIKEKQNWRYDYMIDEMTDKPSLFATNESENVVEFGFPYRGVQHATLTLRTHPKYGKDVIVSIERGQILCPSYDGCSVSVRFDDGKVQKFRASPSGDRSTISISLIAWICSEMWHWSVCDGFDVRSGFTCVTKRDSLMME